MKNAGLSSVVIAVVLLAVGAIADAQQPKKVPRIGYLSIPVPLVNPIVPRQFDRLYASVAT